MGKITKTKLFVMISARYQRATNYINRENVRFTDAALATWIFYIKSAIRTFYVFLFSTDMNKIHE